MDLCGLKPLRCSSRLLSQYNLAQLTAKSISSNAFYYYYYLYPKENLA